MNDDLVLSVSQFIAIFNQTLEMAYSNVTVIGELANFRISKNRWVYFNLKDDESAITFFGNVNQLPGPLEDGMILKVKAQPRLHNLYGFKLNVISLQPAGEGSIKKAADLLKIMLTNEGIFDEFRKRALPYPPQKIGLITSKESAAYADFTKILNARWAGIKVDMIDVLVQGEASIEQLISAIYKFNTIAEPPEIIVIIRGGGSPEDLASFSSEHVTRAVAASRVPTLVAIGHEKDISLSELAADKRASTPSNAAELLVPDKINTLYELKTISKQLSQTIKNNYDNNIIELSQFRHRLTQIISSLITENVTSLHYQVSLLKAYDPQVILSRGFSIVRDNQGKLIINKVELKINDIVSIQLHEGQLKALITDVK